MRTRAHKYPSVRASQTRAAIYTDSHIYTCVHIPHVCTVKAVMMCTIDDVSVSAIACVILIRHNPGAQRDTRHAPPDPAETGGCGCGDDDNSDGSVHLCIHSLSSHRQQAIDRMNYISSTHKHTHTLLYQMQQIARPHR